MVSLNGASRTFCNCSVLALSSTLLVSIVPSAFVLPGILMVTLISAPLVRAFVEALVETRCVLLGLSAEECLGLAATACGERTACAFGGTNCFRKDELLRKSLTCA